MKGDYARGTGHDRLVTIRKKMIPLKRVSYGQTPWDALDKEDLIFLLQSYHAVVQGASSALEINTLPGLRSGICEESMAECRAAVDSVFSDYLGRPYPEKVRCGGKRVRSPAGQDEQEVFWRAVMRPVGGLLAFDVPSSIWWACANCDNCIGLRPGEEPTSPRIGTCEGGKRCSFRRATWDDWRRALAQPTALRDPSPGAGQGIAAREDGNV